MERPCDQADEEEGDMEEEKEREAGILCHQWPRTVQQWNRSSIVEETEQPARRECVLLSRHDGVQWVIRGRVRAAVVSVDTGRVIGA